jgi:glycosyltransferase involved in cell wall biosynthesis
MSEDAVSGGGAPKVNVVIPCYNYAGYVEEAIGSVLLQTYKDYVLTLVNDGSTDDSLSVLRRYEGRPGVVVVDQANQGLSAARNAGISAVESLYVLTLDADDLILPTFLEKTVPLMESDSGLGFVYTYIAYFGDEHVLVRNHPYDFQVLKYDNFVNSCTLFRRDAWVMAGGFNTEMVYGCEDWDFWINVAKRGWPGRLVPEPLFLYRRHGVSMVSGVADNRERIVGQIRANHPEIYP